MVGGGNRREKGDRLASTWAKERIILYADLGCLLRFKKARTQQSKRKAIWINKELVKNKCFPKFFGGGRGGRVLPAPTSKTPPV